MAIELQLPIGTQVVTLVAAPDQAGQAHPAGRLGRVKELPTQERASYRVELADGSSLWLARHELQIHKHRQREGLLPSHDDAELAPYIIYRCVVGSRAYGLDDENSDSDRRGIFLPPARFQWSLGGLPEQIEDEQTRDTYWELQKFLILALKANPNALECLSTPLVEYASPLAEELLSLRDCFLSRSIYQTYNGYVLSQFKRLEQDLRTRGEIKLKHAMHLIRLLLAGIHVLREGELLVRVIDERKRLLAIKHGQMEWDEVNTWRLELHREFDHTFMTSQLPERPDYERINQFLLKARRSMVDR
jgi:predicted nucleotidyltransferase